MTQAPKSLSVAALFVEREARRRNEQEAIERLQRRKEEELAAYKQRLENFHLVDEMIPGQLERLRGCLETATRGLEIRELQRISKCLPAKPGAFDVDPRNPG